MMRVAFTLRQNIIGNQIKTFFCASLILLAFSGCKTLLEEKSTPDFGVTLVEIDIAQEDLAKLNASVSAKIPISTEITISGSTFKAHVAYAGASTLDDFKKSMHFTFKNGETYRRHSQLRLSAQSTDPSAVRSLVGYAVYEWSQTPTSFIFPAALYINKEYAGLYYAIEPVEKSFFDLRNRPVVAIYKAKGGHGSLESSAATSLAQNFGAVIKPKSYQHLEQLVEIANEENSPENKAALARIVNIDAYLRYVAASVYLKNWDGYDNNVFFVRASDGRFFPVPWDVDKVFEYNSERETFAAGKSIFGRNQLTKQILSYPDWKKNYLEILDKFLDEHPIKDAIQLVADYQGLVASAAENDRVFHAQDFRSHQERLREEIKSWLTSVRQDVEVELKKAK